MWNEKTDEFLGNLRVSGVASLQMQELEDYLAENEVEIIAVTHARGGWTVHCSNKVDRFVSRWE